MSRPTRQLVLISLIAFGILSADRAEAKAPNIVVILADDLGWSDLGCYGADLHETPRLDQLAKDALRFTQAYSAAPVCTPTRAALLTGKHPTRLNITTWFESSSNPTKGKKLIPPTTSGNLDLAEVTLAERLHAAGYFTALVGKWHLGDALHYPEVQGFDQNIGGTFWGAPATHFAPYLGKVTEAEERRYVPGLSNWKKDEYLADRLTSEAIKVIQQHRGEPFFLYLAYHAVHTPLEAPTDLVEKYRAKIRPEMKHQNPTYAAMVENLDTNVGRVLDAIKEQGIEDETLVVFTSDNGGYLRDSSGTSVTSNHPLRSGKGSLYEGGIRVPLLIKWPGRTKPGATSNVPVVTMDLHATIMDAVEQPQPTLTDGVSLLPIVDAKPHTSFERPFYFHFPHYYPTTTPASGIRDGVWKLIHYYEDGHDELFDLKSDPGEVQNVLGSNPEKGKELRSKLENWIKQVNAPLPSASS
jgi:arylsulfatase A-like enzyme